MPMYRHLAGVIRINEAVRIVVSDHKREKVTCCVI